MHIKAVKLVDNSAIRTPPLDDNDQYDDFKHDNDDFVQMNKLTLTHKEPPEPDGFGDTAEDEQIRNETNESYMTRDYSTYNSYQFVY
jgi:hypothetical protein